ncbi:MAG: hypothetical protein ABI670_04215 [Chloroflexota bacterium]
MINANANAAVAPVRREEGEPEWMVWVTVAVALVLGFFLMWYITNQTTAASAGGTTLSYPATWVQTSESGAAFAVADLRNGGTFGDRAAVFELPKAELLPRDGGLQEAAANYTLAQQDARVGYRVLSVHSLTVQNRDAIQIESGYLLDSPYGGTSMPALMHGIDTIVMSGDTFYVLSYATRAGDVDNATSANDKLVNNWRLP